MKKIRRNKLHLAALTCLFCLGVMVYTIIRQSSPSMVKDEPSLMDENRINERENSLVPASPAPSNDESGKNNEMIEPVTSSSPSMVKEEPSLMDELAADIPVSPNKLSAPNPEKSRMTNLSDRSNEQKRTENENSVVKDKPSAMEELTSTFPILSDHDYFSKSNTGSAAASPQAKKSRTEISPQTSSKSYVIKDEPSWMDELVASIPGSSNHSDMLTLENADKITSALERQQRQQNVNLEKLRDRLESAIDAIDNGLPGFHEIVPNCSRLAEEALYADKTDYVWNARKWQFNETEFRDMLFGPTVEKRCQSIRKNLAFSTEPMSDVESEYPLAYGLLVYESSMQIYLLMSVIYQPQNTYCIAVDSKSNSNFTSEMELLSDCFPNIFVMQTSDVEWCGFSVARGVFNCLRHLSEMNHKWKYFQYLSGMDLPLKTNLEMVRIFKRLKGTVNAEVLQFEDRLLGPLSKIAKPPLPLWKTSLSALLPRESVDAMFRSEKVYELFNYLKDTVCADETLWVTIMGNINVLQIPGAFDASAVFAKIEKEKNNLYKILNSTNATFTKSFVPTLEEPFPMNEYDIARYQVWYERTAPPRHMPYRNCAGKYVRDSCVFGVGDLKTLMIRPEMVAHKFYLDFEPAAYFCLYKSVRKRALDHISQHDFRGALYSKLPQVRMAEGEQLDQVQFYFMDF